MDNNKNTENRARGDINRRGNNNPAPRRDEQSRVNTQHSRPRRTGSADDISGARTGDPRRADGAGNVRPSNGRTERAAQSVSGRPAQEKRDNRDNRENRVSSAEPRHANASRRQAGNERAPAGHAGEQHLRVESRKARSRRRRNTVLISIASFLAVLAVVVFVLWRVVDDYTPEQDPGPIVDDTTAPPTETVDDDGTPPVPAGSTIDRKTGFYTMLAVGHDRVAVNTDVIMLASYDVANEKISVLQIPRDTYFELYGNAHKINSMFAIERDTSVKDEGERIRTGMEGMASDLEKGLGIPIDFWAMVDLDQFGDLVDTVGGVPIDLAYDMDYEDPVQDLYIHLKKGYQILDGEKAEQYIRFRKGTNGYAQGDIGRVDAMKVFMSAMLRQVKNNLSISTIPKIAETAIGMVDTDMKVLDCVYFGKNFMKNVDMSNVSFVTLPGEAVNAGTSYYVMNKADMVSLMNSYFNPYMTEITEEMFDPAGMFGKNATDEQITAVYNAPSSESLEESVHNAGDINTSGLDISLVGGGS